MEKTFDKVKDWLFPGIASLVGLLLWSTVQDIKSDIGEVKADIKILIASSNADHVRIDGLERVVYGNKSTASVPSIPDESNAETSLATLTKKIELTDER